MHHPEAVMLAASALILLAVGASKLSARFGVPIVVLFLAIGMLAGSDGPGGIAFDDYDAARAVGVVALALILFSGGLGTRRNEARPVLRPAIALATIGVVVTAAITAVTAAHVFDLSAKEAFLLGAIVSSTDAAAVFVVLRGRAGTVPASVRNLLEVESGLNDPMAVFLTLGTLELLTHTETPVANVVLEFVAQMGIGTIAGFAAGAAMIAIVNRVRLDFDGLYPVMTLALAALTYAVTDAAHGSGFLAVYIAGVRLGNARVVHHGTIVRFHDAVAWLMQITMFLVLGLLVFPRDLDNIAGRALVVTAVLCLVARPVATFVSLLGSRVPIRQQALVSWLGLRGAVPIVLATFPEAEHLGKSALIFDVVFFVVLASVLLQGTTIVPVARLLRIEPDAVPAGDAIDPVAAAEHLHDVVVGPHAGVDGHRIVDLALPRGALVVLVARDGQRFVPEGSTVVRAGDRLLVAAGDDEMTAVRRLLSGE